MNTSGLTGKRILVTRPRAQAGGLVEALSALGAVPVVFPTIEIDVIPDVPLLDRAITNLTLYRWVIFTSVNGVAAFWQRLTTLGKDSAAFHGIGVAAIGPATAQSLREHGVKPDFVPDEHVAEAIVPGLGDVRGRRILLPRAELARKALVDELARLGAQPEEIAVYSTHPGQPASGEWDELEKGVDVATFTSSSTVRNFCALLGSRTGQVLQGALVACIGPVTAQTAQDHGLKVGLVAEDYTTSGLVAALLAYYRAQPERKRS
jgi:uroporphyrinogen III methyltransferase/synthase